MKRKIIFVLLAVSLVLTMSVTAFAYDGDLLPAIPDNSYEYCMVTKNTENRVELFLFNSPAVDIDGWVDIKGGGDSYVLKDGKWVYDNAFYMTSQYKSWVLYDSTGLFGSNDKSGIFDMFVPVGFKDFKDIHKGLANQLNVVTVVNVLVFGAFIVGGLVFMWWGVRKIVRVFMTAYRKGKISL